MLTILFRQNILYLEIFLNTFERSDAMAFADTFKALSDPARREILQLLKNGRMSAGEIGSHFHMTGATVSYHLKILKKADLIWETKEKNFIYYDLNTSVVEELLLWLKDLKGDESHDESPILIGLLLWNQLPAKLPTHFSTGNTPDGWSSKAITVFGLPLFMFAMMWFCFLFTYVDPKRQNISPKLIRALVWFMAALSPIVVCSSYAIALGINVNITLLTYLIIGLMLLVIGNYLAKTKQNYSAGIRIPWTLSSEENWNRTHRVSSRLFIFCGLAMIANGFLDSKILLFFIMAVLIVIPYAYSFFLFKKGI